MTDPAVPALPVPRLLLWRHGRTEWNAAGRFQGQLDPPLDEEGRRQADLAARQLVAGGLRAEDTVVVSSDLSRAVATGTALADLLGVPLRRDTRLREHGMGCWEGLTRAEVADRFPDQYADWLAGRPVRGRGGEEAEHVADRAVAALADLPSAAVAVVVTHGGTAGRLIERLLGLGTQHRRILGPLTNCAWSELTTQAAHWRLIRHNAGGLEHADGRGRVGDREVSVATASATTVGNPPDAGASPEEGAAIGVGDADAVL